MRKGIHLHLYSEKTMKKILLFLFGLVALSFAFQACDDQMTYAEKLEAEENAIQAFIEKHNINLITQSDFHAQDSMTNLDKNEYVQLASGVYMQIVSKGVENVNDTVKANDLILVRYSEVDVETGDTIMSNIADPQTVDVFKYTVTSSSIAGIFTEGSMLSYRGTTVPAGWLLPFTYVRNMAHVRLIVPSKMGHSTAQQYVTPYYYDLAKLQIYK